METMPNRQLRQHQDYIESGCWKCDKSPTGAHYWIETPSKTKVNSGLFYCKYCLDAKKMPVHFGDALVASGVRRIPSQSLREITRLDVADIRPQRRIK